MIASKNRRYSLMNILIKSSNGITQVSADSKLMSQRKVFIEGEHWSLKLNVPLDEILYLPVGHIIVFHRGQKPVFSTRYDIYNDEFYKKITKEYENKSNRSLEVLLTGTA